MFAIALAVAALTLAGLVATTTALPARRRDREQLDAARAVPTSHRATGRSAHNRQGWQLTPPRGVAVARFNPGTVDDTVMFRAVTLAGTSGDAA